MRLADWKVVSPWLSGVDDRRQWLKEEEEFQGGSNRKNCFRSFWAYLEDATKWVHEVTPIR